LKKQLARNSRTISTATCAKAGFILDVLRQAGLARDLLASIERANGG
jgi:hypothetical protein